MAADASDTTTRTDAGTGDLVRRAFEEARTLMSAEVALAKDELKAEIRSAERAAIGFGVAAGAAIVALSVLAVALVLAMGGTALAALIVALGFLVVGGVAGTLAYGSLPKKAMTDTRARIEEDAARLKERVT